MVKNILKFLGQFLLIFLALILTIIIVCAGIYFPLLCVFPNDSITVAIITGVIGFIVGIILIIKILIEVT